MTNASTRETFTSRLGTILTMVGVALGLGNVWRFPYLVGRYGGAAFVIFYTIIALVIGVPGLMAEWALGRHTRRGTLGAFEAGGFPGGRYVGWFLFIVVVAATAYYTNVVGWVLYFTVGQLLAMVGISWQSAAVLPPASGVDTRALFLQIASTVTVSATSAFVLDRGLRKGIEKVSTLLMPVLLIVLVLLIARAVTLPGAGPGIKWYIGKFHWHDLTPTVMVAALGHAVFSLSLGGTFMVTYGSYLGDREPLLSGAVWTTLGDTISGVMAGFVIFPAVFAFGLEPTSGPSLVFDTLPHVFSQMPGGALFGVFFYFGLLGAGYLSDIAAFEVLIAGITDNTKWSRRRAVWTAAAVVCVVAIIPMFNMRIFVPWDLTFGSGMQTLGALLAVITAGWFMHRAALLEALGPAGLQRAVLLFFIRYVIPIAMLAVGLYWMLTDVLGVLSPL